MRTLWVFLKRDAAIEASYQAAFLARFSSVLFWVVFFAAAGRLLGAAAGDITRRYGGSYTGFVLLGVAFGTYLQSGVTAFPQRLREAQLAGTVEATLMSPVSPVAFVVALGLWDHIVTTIQVAAYLLCGVLFLALDMRGANIPGALAVLALGIVAFDALGIIGAGLVLVTRRGVTLAPLLAIAAGLLSGVYFPVEVLPPGARALAMLLPSTHALAGLRLALLGGAGWPDLLPSIGALALFDLVFAPGSLLAFHWATRYALRAGTLGQY
jgi:ABC-type multidrug transport system permease subunit